VVPPFHKTKRKRKKKEEEEEVMPAPVEVPEESGAFDKGFAKEMPDEGGTCLLSRTFTGIIHSKI
jgi:hypothetical protein